MKIIQRKTKNALFLSLEENQVGNVFYMVEDFDTVIWYKNSKSNNDLGPDIDIYPYGTNFTWRLEGILFAYHPPMGVIFR